MASSSFWVPLALLAGGAGVGALAGSAAIGASAGGILGGSIMGAEKNKQAQKTQEMQTKMRAAEQRYSPWTGQKNFTEITPAGSMAGEMGAGALQFGQTGFSLGSNLDKTKMFGETLPEYGKSMFAKSGQTSPDMGVNMRENPSSIYEQMIKRRGMVPQY